MRFRQCFLFFIGFSFFTIFQMNGQVASVQKHREVALRMVGHQLLLTTGDSTSRVLPIERSGEVYSIHFERGFAFDPADLVQVIDKVSKEAYFDEDYVAEVLDCDSGKVVYAFENVLERNRDLIPCGGRLLPNSCYQILFTFNHKQNDLSVVEESSQLKEDESGSGYFIWMLLGATLLIVIIAIWNKKSKEGNPKDSNLIPLGKYHFNKVTSQLTFAEQHFDLTGKEAELLWVLYETKNNTVERDVLLNRVWGDEGDYIGRTLDVFISKLRKKLELDSDIKIVNVRGVGYKLVMSV